MPSVVEPSTPPASPENLVEPLGHKTARGFAWMVSQTLLTKALGTISTLALAALILREHFGLVALAYTYSVIPALIQQNGLREVLVQRHLHFARWANAAFWMTMTLGTLSGVIMAAMAPLAAAWEQSTTLLGLLMIISITFPLDALSIVPQANLQNHLRFRFLAALALGQAIMQLVLSIAFALLGFGAYSIILPRPIIAVATALACWWAAPSPILRKPQYRRWRLLLGDSAMVMIGTGCVTITMYAGNFILSLFRDEAVVGDYYFAYNLSLQTIVLLTQNLGGVLYPALSRLQYEPARQTLAFLRATRMLAFFTFPACFLQAALARPLLQGIYGHKWDLAIPLLEILSLAMAVRTFGWPASNLLMAQARFATRAVLSIFSLLLFIAMVTYGAWRGGAIGLATAVALHMVITEPVHLVAALWHGRKALASFWRVVAGPLVVAVLAVFPAHLAGRWILQLSGNLWLSAAAIAIVAGALYLPLLRWGVPDVWHEARQRIHALLGRAA